MHVWSFLLRILLSLALVLNGATATMAAVQMEAPRHAVEESMPPEHVAQKHAAQEHAGHEHAAASSMSMHGTPCHHHDGAIKSPPTDMASADGDSTTGKGRHPSPDCCKTGSCRCACMQTMQVVAAAWTAHAPLLNQAANLRPLPRGHAEPALPHLIRPPIG